MKIPEETYREEHVATGQTKEFVVPAYYAVLNFIKEIGRINSESIGKNHWLVKFGKDARKKRADIQAVAMEILSGIRNRSIVSSRIESGKRLGKPSLKVISNRLIAEEVICDEGGKWGNSGYVLLMRRDTAQIRRDHLEEHSVLTGFAITRHALERLYSRRDLNQNNINSRIRNDIKDISEYLAFAIRARLCSQSLPGKEGVEFVLPAGNGLLMMRNVIFMTKKGSVTESRLKPSRDGRMIDMPVKQNRSRMVELQPVNGVEVEGHVMTLGITYITKDMLSFEQRAYLWKFKEEAKKHDLARISDELYQINMKHEKEQDLPEIDIDWRLHYLFSLTRRTKPLGKHFMAIGWNGKYDVR